MPEWVTEDEVYFITINMLEGYIDSLANDKHTSLIKNTFGFYHTQRKIAVQYLLIMPNHIHALIVFGKDIVQPISNIKRFISKNSNIRWQENFFDHRIRNDEQLQIKYEYIRHNPVRKGLVGNPDDWKYQWWKEDF